MSIWTSLFAAPQPSRRMSQGQFEAFLFDLLHQRIVQMPCAVLGGAVDVQLPLGMADLFDGVRYLPLVNGVPQVDHAVTFEAYQAGAVLPFPYQVEHYLKKYQAGTRLAYEDKGFITFYYQGEEEALLRQALRDFPYGQQDLCLWFCGLDYENPTFADLANYTSSPDTLVYALAHPQTVVCCGDQWVSREELEAREGVEFAANVEFEANYVDGNWEEGRWEARANEYQVEWCFRTAAMKGGPYEIIGTPLEPILKQHFGPDLFTDCNYS